MATTRPAAVVMRASEMPGATARRVAAPAVPSPRKALTMPMTVPKRPMKGASLGDGGEPGHALFHGGEGFGGGGEGGALEGDGIAGHAASAGLALVLVVDLGEDVDEGAGAELVGEGGDLGEAAGLAEGAEEVLGLAAGAGEGAPLGEHDGPGEDAEQKQEDEDGKGDGAGVADHFHERAAGTGGGGRCGGLVLEEEEREQERGGRQESEH